MVKTCCNCGGFLVGDRVALTEKWSKATHGMPPIKYPVGRKGRVTGFSRTPGCLMVKFNGRKISTSFHQSFFTRLVSTAAGFDLT
jgi:hypothetical protein